jgi:hypothetical protein
MSNISNTGSSSRLKGLVWAVGGIALIVIAVSLAPVISHFG